MIIFLRNCGRYFLFAGIFSIFINTLQLTFSLYMLAVYDGVLSSSSYPTLYVITALALTALAVWGCLEFCRSKLLIMAGIKLDGLLSHQVLKNMLQDLCRVDTTRYTDGLRDINTLRNYLGGNAIFAFFDVPWIFIYLGILYLVHPIVGLTATAGAVVNLVLGLLQGRLTQDDTQHARRWSFQSRQWLLTSFRTARELQTMGMIVGAAHSYCAINDREMAHQDKASKVGHVLGAISSSFGILMQVLIYGVGATLLLANEASQGVIIASSIIMGQALAPIRRGIDAWKQTAGAKTAYHNLNQLLTTTGQQQPLKLEQCDGGLQVSGVSLTINENPILAEIDFSLQPGEIMGLLGPNGAGKTSLCRMILGMWQPSHGVVKLDNQDVFLLDSDDLGRFVGYLPQNVELFTGTVAENIARMGAVQAEKVVEAAQWAGAHEIFLRFPKGYETDIGEAGLSLSGGQRQRIGLARALYGNPKLVVLDEPNSSLDSPGEQALIQALQGLKQRRATTIMITHKTSLLSAVDKILVLKNGEQALFGGRDEVLRQLTGASACER